MDIQTRKLEFIQKFLQLQNEEAISWMEDGIIFIHDVFDVRQNPTKMMDESR
ncbi:hypothetical protein [Limibacterium fermenti]|jgi:hypothetical protein|uniref:hypothetical protein n=1 Tax=Limibacterium fermenti TaxID=3229863 RepID=UPI0026CF8117